VNKVVTKNQRGWIGVGASCGWVWVWAGVEGWVQPRVNVEMA
jgi:hypothetical protein